MVNIIVPILMHHIGICIESDSVESLLTGDLVPWDHFQAEFAFEAFTFK